MYNEQEIRKNYEKLTKLLIEKNMTITTMESCTSGQLASLITDTEGASAVLKGAFVTYCNEAKIMQGVPEEIIEKHSVYSKETACAMADACRKAYNADIGVGITGTMGNVDPENANYSSDENGVLYNKDKTSLIRYPSGNGKKEYTVSADVTTIAQYAFAYSQSLENISIPENVTNISYAAFLYCTALKRIDGIASEICNLTNLTHLYLSHTYIDINDRPKGR